MQKPSALLRSIIISSRNQAAILDSEQPVAVADKVTSLSARHAPAPCLKQLRVTFQRQEPGFGESKERQSECAVQLKPQEKAD